MERNKMQRQICALAFERNSEKQQKALSQKAKLFHRTGHITSCREVHLPFLVVQLLCYLLFLQENRFSSDCITVSVTVAIVTVPDTVPKPMYPLSCFSQHSFKVHEILLFLYMSLIIVVSFSGNQLCNASFSCFCHSVKISHCYQF